MTIKSINVEDFNSLLEQQSGVQLLRFWAPWCAPCRMMSPLYKEAAATVGNKALFCEVNVDEQPELAAAHSIRSIPAIVVYKDGEPVESFVGVKNARELEQLVESYL